MPVSRLKKGDINIMQVYALSKQYYKAGTVDDKKHRAKLDIISGKAIQRNNLEFNPETKTWEQTGRETKIVFQVSSHPKSYKSIDTVKVHKYPVTFLFKDISQGVLSPFRWRTGGLKNIKFPKKGSSQKEHIKITDQNIRNENQLNFFFNIEFVSATFGTLYGRCRAKWFPRKTNPQGLLYFDKTSFFVVEHILLPLLASGKGLQMNKSVKNKAVK